MIEIPRVLLCHKDLQAASLTKEGSTAVQGEGALDECCGELKLVQITECPGRSPDVHLECSLSCSCPTHFSGRHTCLSGQVDTFLFRSPLAADAMHRLNVFAGNRQ